MTPDPGRRKLTFQVTRKYMRRVTLQSILRILPFLLGLKCSLFSNLMHTKLHIFHCIRVTLLQFRSVQLLSRVQLFGTPWIAASVSITNSQSLLKLMSIELEMPSSHLILCRPLLLLSPIPPSIRVFSNKSTLQMRWPKYCSFSFSISPSNEHLGLISFRMVWVELLAV